MKSYEKQQWITGYKSASSIINQATLMIMADNGGTLLNAWGGMNDNQGMYNAYLPYLHVAKKCENQDPEGSCFASHYAYMGLSTNSFDSDFLTDYSVILSNGTSLGIRSMQGAFKEGLCNRIYVDVNGKKGPNVYGKDFNELQIHISSDPVQSYGDTYAPAQIIGFCPSDLNSGLGLTCGTRIMRGDYGEDY